MNAIEALETLRGLIENEKNVVSYKIQGHNDRVRMTDKDYYRANGEICGLLAAMIIIDREIDRIRKGEEL